MDPISKEKQGTFTATQGDTLRVSSQKLSGQQSVGYIAALLAIEESNPGSLAGILRLSALLAEDWQVRSTSSNPAESLAAQQRLLDWIDRFVAEYYNTAPDPEYKEELT